MANLQNYKKVKIRMDDMISQQFFGSKIFAMFTITVKFMDTRYLVFIADICNLVSVAICWRGIKGFKMQLHTIRSWA